MKCMEIAEVLTSNKVRIVLYSRNETNNRHGNECTKVMFCIYMYVEKND